MIVFDIHCLEPACSGETFEAWFRSNAEFEDQQAAGLVQCPFCKSARIAKAPMAPNVPRKSADCSLTKIAALQAEMLKDSRWVGDEFADTARAMHSGEIERAQVHGNATLADARSLIDDGITVAPLPLPVLPPNQIN
jgi:hypothetical protein